MSSQSVESRLERIRKIIAENAALTVKQNNEAFHWKADCEYLVQRVDDLTKGIQEQIANCGGCAGRGFETWDNNDGDVEKEPCNACWDLRELIQDHTDYVLKATQAKAPPAPVERVVPFVRCTKLEFCTMADGHAGACDDIPF